jgi:hypothetical protein
MPESQEANESTIKIDEKEYQVDSLSDEAKSQIISMRIAEQEIVRLNQKLAMVQTARNSYAAAIRENLPEDE